MGGGPPPARPHVPNDLEAARHPPTHLCVFAKPLRNTTWNSRMSTPVELRKALSGLLESQCSTAPVYVCACVRVCVRVRMFVHVNFMQGDGASRH